MSLISIDQLFLPENIAIIIIVGVLIIFGFLCWLFLFLEKRKRKSFKKMMHMRSNSIRVFCINVETGEVTYFNLTDIKNKRIMTITDFYSQFHKDDWPKIEQWFNRLLSKQKNVETSIGVDVHLTSIKNDYFSILQVTNVQYDKKMIYLESHLMENSIQNARVKTSDVVIDRIEITRKIRSSSYKGITFVIRFYYAKSKGRINDEKERLLFARLRNEIYPFVTCSKARHLLEVDKNDLVLFDLRMINTQSAFNLANEIAHSLRSYIDISSLHKEVDFAIGIIENKNFPKHLEQIIMHGQEASLKAEEMDNRIYLYNRNEILLTNAEYFEPEVSRIIKENSVKNMYRPILSLSHPKPFGYFVYSTPYDSPFTSINAVKDYASKCGLQTELFNVLAKSIVPKFANEKDGSGLRLIMPVSIKEKDSISKVLLHTSGIDNVKLILLFDEFEINFMVESANELDDEPLSFLDVYKKKGWEIGLSLRDKDLLLAPKIYGKFDIFVIGGEMTRSVFESSRVRLAFQTLVEKLLKYKKPIVASDLDGWPSIELMIKLGLKYISSETLSPSDDMILPFDKRKLQKVNALNIFS